EGRVGRVRFALHETRSVQRRLIRHGCPGGCVSQTTFPARSSSRTLGGHCCVATRSRPFGRRTAEIGCWTFISQVVRPSLSYSTTLLFQVWATTIRPLGWTSIPPIRPGRTRRKLRGSLPAGPRRRHWSEGARPIGPPPNAGP